jgi:hypothetical protein
MVSEPIYWAASTHVSFARHVFSPIDTCSHHQELFYPSLRASRLQHHMFHAQNNFIFVEFVAVEIVVRKFGSSLMIPTCPSTAVQVYGFISSTVDRSIRAGVRFGAENLDSINNEA